MIISEFQLSELHNVFTSVGLPIEEFEESIDTNGYCIYHKIENTLQFNIRNSINGATIGDVFCKPYTYMDSFYKGCNSFNECLKYAREWSVVSKYKLNKKQYYHKIFISHASKDKPIIDSFVDRVLRLSCGFKTSDIIYTSREDTGVALGEGIPEFIKTNLLTSSLVLFMISDNYKKSEVCLNEMGAAWALDKKTVSIILPNCGFESLGWLTSLNKAVRIDSMEGLDALYTMLSRTEPNIEDWNHQKTEFLKECKSLHRQSKSSTLPGERVERQSGNLRLFDNHYIVRAIDEGVFQYQINLRIRALENVVLRRVYIRNDNEFVGNSMKAEKKLEFYHFIPMSMIDIDDLKPEEMKKFLITEYKSEAVRINDYQLSKESQLSITFLGEITTIRECDGYEDLPLNHWTLCIEYNEDESVNLPLKMNVIGDCKDYFWRN